MIRVVAAVICESGRYLITRRPPGSAFEGLWEFPGGKTETGESDEHALIREIKEELGIGIAVGDLFASVSHRYETFDIYLRVYLASIISGKIVPSENQEYLWADPDDFDRFTFVEADYPIVKRLTEEER
ncbi:MAG: (deoxy)nucleoside triphosphate pyrophosphohydrolase [Candidatus Omnitrophica bacterium]|nr:(deoxy)nucleoside triphosphate pyrophosphohydrolase [Candidatus Omnitrophota bacterium]